MAEDSKPDKWRLIRGTNLKSEDRHVLLTLFLFQGDNGAAFCKQETLADEIGVHPRSVRRSLQRLNEAGIVVSEWKILSNVPMRVYAIQFDALKTVQRGNGRTPASYPETADGRTPASATVGHQRPKPQDTSVLQEDPLNIQGISTLGNSPNSLASSGRKPKAKSDGKLTAFCFEWNAWHSAGIVRQKIRDTNSPGKTIVDAWNRSQRDPEQRGRLDDLSGLRSAIESSQALLKPAAWFDAAGLIGGKNKNHRWYAEQLAAGTYRDKATNGAAVNAEALQAWQKILRAAEDNHGNAAGFESDIGGQLAGIVKALRLTRQKIDQASPFDRREQEREFLQAFSRQGAAA